MKEKSFEDIFKDKLSHFEADVNPSVWQSVQSGMAGKGAAASGASGASQAAGTFAGLGAKGMLWIAGAALVAGAGLYYILGEGSPVANEKVAVSQPSQSTVPVETSVADNQQPVPPVPDNHQVTESKADIPVAVRQEPALAENKSKQTTSTKEPEVTAAAPATAPAETQKREEPAVSPRKTEESQGPATAPAIASAPAIEKSLEPSAGALMFDTLEKYLLGTRNGDAKLPNKFTPDGDGYNDVFTLQTNGLKSLEVTIFLHGAVVAKWNDLNGSWNGLLSNGKVAEAGTYYYSVKAMTEEGKICISNSMLMLSR